jgi:hypothetical protein
VRSLLPIASALVLGGISLDLWRAYSERRALANLADAAAVVGASAVDVDAYRGPDGTPVLDVELARRRAADSLLAQTDTRSLVDAAITATPASIEVSVYGQVDLTLLRLFDLGEPFEVLVTARSQPIPIDAQPTAPPG